MYTDSTFRIAYVRRKAISNRERAVYFTDYSPGFAAKVQLNLNLTANKLTLTMHVRRDNGQVVAVTILL